jgi:hypothetical protein
VEVAHLQRGGINVASLTSLTPKEDISEVYKTIESDEGLRLIYGTLPPLRAAIWL